MLAHYDLFVRCTKIVTFDERALGVSQQHLRGVVVGHARETTGDALELGDVALEGLQLCAATAQDLFDHVHGHILRQLDQLLQVGEGDLGLEHPELGQVTSGLGLLRTESRAEGEDLAKGHGRGLGVQLTRLGQEGLLVEVADLEESTGALAGRRA